MNDLSFPINERRRNLMRTKYTYIEKLSQPTTIVSVIKGAVFICVEGVKRIIYQQSMWEQTHLEVGAV